MALTKLKIVNPPAHFQKSILLGFMVDSIFNSSEFYSNYLCHDRASQDQILSGFNIQCTDRDKASVLYISLYNSIIAFVA